MSESNGGWERTRFTSSSAHADNAGSAESEWAEKSCTPQLAATTHTSNGNDSSSAARRGNADRVGGKAADADRKSGNSFAAVAPEGISGPLMFSDSRDRRAVSRSPVIGVTGRTARVGGRKCRFCDLPRPGSDRLVAHEAKDHVLCASTLCITDGNGGGWTTTWTLGGARIAVSPSTETTASTLTTSGMTSKMSCWKCCASGQGSPRKRSRGTRRGRGCGVR